MNDETAIIQTVDFFTPVVDDPYTFGQIAAANALSDIYAMGGKPVLALNIVAFPNCLDPAILGDILAGGADKVKESGAVLAGGHSIQDDEPKYGLCVTGFVHPDAVRKNFGTREGDVLILTKQIGSGIINTAVKGEVASRASAEEAVKVMTSLNKKAIEASAGFTIHACTDITGFGLAGHAVEVAKASNVTLDIDAKSVPFITDAADYAKMGLVPAGTYRNRGYSGKDTDTGAIEDYLSDLMFDPQTSGGLLFSIPADEEERFMKSLQDAKLETKAACIGRASAFNGKNVVFH